MPIRTKSVSVRWAMASYRYRVVHEETGVVKTGMVHEWPEKIAENKKQAFADALEEEGFILYEFEELWIN